MSYGRTQFKAGQTVWVKLGDYVFKDTIKMWCGGCALGGEQWALETYPNHVNSGDIHTNRETLCRAIRKRILTHTNTVIRSNQGIQKLNKALEGE